MGVPGGVKEIQEDIGDLQGGVKVGVVGEDVCYHTSDSRIFFVIRKDRDE